MSPLPTRRSTTRTTNKLGARTLPMERSDDAWDAHDDGQEDETLPRRPRRQFFNRGTASLAALITCAAGFYAGIRIEKGQLASSSSALSTTGTASARSSCPPRPRSPRPRPSAGRPSAPATASSSPA